MVPQRTARAQTRGVDWLTKASREVAFGVLVEDAAVLDDALAVVEGRDTTRRGNGSTRSTSRVRGWHAKASMVIVRVNRRIGAGMVDRWPR